MRRVADILSNRRWNLSDGLKQPEQCVKQPEQLEAAQTVEAA
jgi:hypothetical protein